MKPNERYTKFTTAGRFVDDVNITESSRLFMPHALARQGKARHGALKECRRCREVLLRAVRLTGITSVRGGSSLAKFSEVAARRYRNVAPCGAPGGLSGNFIRRVVNDVREALRVNRERGAAAAIAYFRESQDEGAEFRKNVRRRAITSFNDRLRKLHDAKRHGGEALRCRDCETTLRGSMKRRRTDEDEVHRGEGERRAKPQVGMRTKDAAATESDAVRYFKEARA